MGNHRGQRRAAPRRRSTTSDLPTADPSTATSAKREKYVGRRVAGRTADQISATREAAVTAPEPIAPEPQLLHVEDTAAFEPTLATQQPRFAAPMPTVELPSLAELTGDNAISAISDSSTTRSPASPGKRRAVKHAGPRGSLFKGLPTLPVAVGVATLAVAVGGTVVSAEPELVGNTDKIGAANAISGAYGSGTYDATRTKGVVSRDSDRDTLEDATDAELIDAAEKLAAKQDEELGKLVKKAEKISKEQVLNAWVLPLSGYRITATYGEYGLWSSYHTGLDFAAPSGTPLVAVTNAVVTSTGYDGAYGEKTVLTLEDGTEIWYCHQSSIGVSPGDVVQAGETIGYVGSTGNVTGPHLHLEVRPGGGDPVDPDAALRQNGIVP